MRLIQNKHLINPAKTAKKNLQKKQTKGEKKSRTKNASHSGDSKHHNYKQNIIICNNENYQSENNNYTTKKTKTKTHGQT
ncbi:MAG: hypothetical protein CMI02_09185 [Oceanospirillaceae bacterium]|nr:hypothetical protein [Oceanospirillaceae bacterium]